MIDLDAIRKRDADWKETGSPRLGVAARDRRSLLRHIDELEAAAEEIQDLLAAIRRVHREHYVAKVPSVPPPALETKTTG